MGASIGPDGDHETLARKGVISSPLPSGPEDAEAIAIDMKRDAATNEVVEISD